MKKNLKRLSAFILDILLLVIFFMILYYFVPTKDTTDLNNNITEITEKVLNHEIGKVEYYNEFSKNMYLLDYGRVVFTGLNTLIIMLYFIIVPIITKGYTLGLYITGLKLDGKINIKNLIMRNLISTGLLYLILSILAVCFTKDTLYFSLISILGIIQFLLVIISTFMIIYRKDQKGLQDIISDTKVVSASEVKK